MCVCVCVCVCVCARAGGREKGLECYGMLMYLAHTAHIVDLKRGDVITIERRSACEGLLEDGP